jgi:hypothetical protein
MAHDQLETYRHLDTALAPVHLCGPSLLLTKHLPSFLSRLSD